MKIIEFERSIQQDVSEFFEICFSALNIPYSPGDRHYDTANIDECYMQNGCFWCLFKDERLIGTAALRVLSQNDKTLELKRLFVLPDFQGNGYGKKLLQHAIEYAKAQNYNKIRLDTIRRF